jgi:hypothetical protein
MDLMIFVPYFARGTSVAVSTRARVSLRSNPRRRIDDENHTANIGTVIDNSRDDLWSGVWVAEFARHANSRKLRSRIAASAGQADAREYTEPRCNVDSAAERQHRQQE